MEYVRKKLGLIIVCLFCVLTAAALASGDVVERFVRAYLSGNSEEVVKCMTPPPSVLSQVARDESEVKSVVSLMETIVDECYLKLFGAHTLKPASSVPQGYQRVGHLSSLNDREMLSLKERPACRKHLYVSDSGDYLVIEECTVSDGGWVRRVEVYSKEAMKGLTGLACIMKYVKSAAELQQGRGGGNKQ